MPVLQKCKILLIGIDRYPHFPKHGLQGAVNDVSLLTATLVEMGSCASHIETLRDRQATRAGILEAMARLLDRVGPGEPVLVAFSGHGSQRLDSSGREPDGLEEVIVPYDSGHQEPHPNRDISGSELYAWIRLLARKTQRILMIFDCCHAGTLLRTTAAGKVRRLEVDTRPSTALETPWAERPPARRADGRLLPVSNQFTCISACRSDQGAFELPPATTKTAWHGALTYFLCQALRAAAPDATYRDVYEDLCSGLAGSSPGQSPQLQSPQLEGAADRRLFHLTRDPVERHSRILQRLDSTDRLILDVGSLHGVQRGDDYLVLPRSARSADQATPLGRIRLFEVREQSADAKVIGEIEPGAITEGLRAFPVRSCDRHRLRLKVTGAPRAKVEYLRAELAGSPFLSLVEATGEADSTLHWVPRRPVAAATSPLPELGPVSEDGWWGVDEGERGLLLHCADRAPDVEAKIRRGLESRVIHHRLRRLSHAKSRRLGELVALDLKRIQTRDTCVDAGPADDRGRFRFHHGERFAFTISNHSSSEIFPYVLCLGAGGGIEPLFPELVGAYEPLAPRTSVCIGLEPGKELCFQIPPSVRTDPYRSRSSWEDILLLLATEKPLNLDWFLSRGRRGSEPARGTLPASLMSALEWAFLGAGNREPAEVEAAPWVVLRARALLEMPPEADDSGGGGAT